MGADPQHWDLDVGEDRHRVTVLAGPVRRTVTWSVDGSVVAEQRSAEDALVLTDPTYGAMRVLHTAWGRTRRVSWYAPADAARAHLGLEGVDPVPEPGSPAAVREQQIRDHPVRFTATRLGVGVGKVALPLVGAWLLAQLAIQLPLPTIDLPRLPLPDLVPDIDLPDPPQISVPGWLAWLWENKSFLIPIVAALLLARAEIARRRRQDALRAQDRQD